MRKSRSPSDQTVQTCSEIYLMSNMYGITLHILTIGLLEGTVVQEGPTTTEMLLRSGPLSLDLSLKPVPLEKLPSLRDFALMEISR